MACEDLGGLFLLELGASSVCCERRLVDYQYLHGIETQHMCCLGSPILGSRTQRNATCISRELRIQVVGISPQENNNSCTARKDQFKYHTQLRSPKLTSCHRPRQALPRNPSETPSNQARHTYTLSNAALQTRDQITANSEISAAGVKLKTA